ncbi:MAG: polyprenyl diphosphate synthase [Candidatus Moraniibacteriota bacterium]
MSKSPSSENPSVPETLPEHLVIIPDGNRRWATARGLKPWEGHEAGAENTKRLGEKVRELGIRQFTIWGSSLENLSKRPAAETRALLDIYARYFAEMAADPDIHENQVRVRFLGRWREQFPKSLRQSLEDLEAATATYRRHGLNFMLAYSGADDMLQAINTLVKSGKREVAPEDVKKALMTADLPAVDFLIRTGGEPHLSAGFMMWDLADSQLFFSDKLYPAFTPKELEAALFDYAQRPRRKGARRVGFRG